MKIHLSDALMRLLAQSAAETGRSLDAEIVHRLEQSYSCAPSESVDVWQRGPRSRMPTLPGVRSVEMSEGLVKDPADPVTARGGDLIAELGEAESFAHRNEPGATVYPFKIQAGASTRPAGGIQSPSCAPLGRKFFGRGSLDRRPQLRVRRCHQRYQRGASAAQGTRGGPVPVKSERRNEMREADELP